MEPRVLGGPIDVVLKKYHLNECIHPIHGLNALLPATSADIKEAIDNVDETGDGKTKFSLSMWTGYTNKKAVFENAETRAYLFWEVEGFWFE